MKTLYIFIVSLTMLTATSKVCAQTNTIPDCNIESADFSLDGESMETSSVISKTGNTLSWIQNHDGQTLTTNFNILNTNGTWDNTSSTGSISMTIEVSGTVGTLILAGTNEALSLQISTINPSDNTSKELIFEVNSIVYL